MLVLTPSLAQASFIVNFGVSAEAVGPDGTATDAVDFDTPHENATTGALQTFNGVDFLGVTGLFDVGVEVTFPNTTDVRVRQSRDRGTTSLSNFFEEAIGVDRRTNQGGLLDSTEMLLTLTGLPTETTFTFTSYHVDISNQGNSFTTSLSGTDVFAQGVVSGTTATLADTAPFTHVFDLTSDATGEAAITYTGFTGAFFFMNGFTLEAQASTIPEPSSLLLLGLLGCGVFASRRRASV